MTPLVINLLDPADCVALSRASAAYCHAEADAAADRGDFTHAADLRRAARRHEQEADRQERDALAQPFTSEPCP